MTTANTLIKRSLRKINAITRGLTPAAEDINEGLEELNSMLGSWSANNLMVPSRTREELTVTQGQRVYTIGQDGSPDFNTPRPLDIETMALVDNNIYYYLRRETQRYYAAEVFKDTQSRPERFYYEPTYPNATIYFDETPDKGYTLVVYSIKPLSSISDTTNQVNLPQHFEDAIVYNLAVRLAPEYGRQVPQEVFRLATETKSVVENQTAAHRPRKMAVDPALTMERGRYNIYGDEY